MATFAGKQAGYSDPTMRHETDQTTAPSETYTFAGEQPKGATITQPTILLKPALPSEV
jgi:hypothetical protein